MLHSLPWQSAPKFNRTYTLIFVGYAIFTLYTTVCYYNQGWYMSKLSKGEANLVCCNVPGNQRYASKCLKQMIAVWHLVTFSQMQFCMILSYRWQQQLVYTSSCPWSMYLACLGPWIGIDYHIQLAGPVAHGDLICPVHAPCTIWQYINILNVYAVSDMFVHLTHYHWSMDDHSLQMSSEFSEWLWVDAVWSILYSDVSWGMEGDNKSQYGLGHCQDKQRRKCGWGGSADNQYGIITSIWGHNTWVVNQATKGGEKVDGWLPRRSIITTSWQSAQ